MQIIHDAGTTKTSGRAFSTGGIGFDIGSAVTSFSNTTQSKLAVECAPPKVELETSSAAIVVLFGFCLAVVGIFAAVISIINKSERPSDWWLFLTTGIIAVIGGYWMASTGLPKIEDVKKRNWGKREEAMAQWRRKFICLKCGRVWIPRNIA